MDIPAHEVEYLRRDLEAKREGVPIRLRGGPLDGRIAYVEPEAREWAHLIAWSVRDECGRLVFIHYRPADDHRQVFEFDSMECPGGGGAG